MISYVFIVWRDALAKREVAVPCGYYGKLDSGGETSRRGERKGKGAWLAAIVMNPTSPFLLTRVSWGSAIDSADQSARPAKPALDRRDACAQSDPFLLSCLTSLFHLDISIHHRYVTQHGR